MTHVTQAGLPDDIPAQLLIAGAWRDGERGSADVHNPATGQVIARVADAGVADGLAALTAAAEAQPGWGRTPARQRAELLRRAFDVVTARAEDLAGVMTLEMGKPLTEARGEVAYAAEFLRWFAEEAPRVSGYYRPSPEGTLRQLVTKRPVGPCLLITPWNFPLAMATRKVAPALAAGCTVVLRPAMLTPLTSLLFAKILTDCGVPPGVVNVVTAQQHDVTDAIIADPRLRKLSFTGSTKVGRTLLRQAADNVLNCSMELGGNAPLIVFDDADLDQAVQGTMLAKLRNMGEACTAANRLLVHESVADEFGRRLAQMFGSLTIGNGLVDGSDIGPLITEQARADIHALVTSAQQAGARVLTGGQIIPGSGYFYPPTVLAGVPRDAAILNEEIFGPVAAISTFATEDEVVARANATSVGLAGYVFTKDVKRILRLAERLEVGMIGVNQGLISNAAAPFGGIKQSGLGREGSHEGIEEYLETVYVALPDPY
ncbi:NAD-dependent succinate-semialdehyde dehydrogenase [Micromonospora sonchi]|uniref:NAD-dependent succinate-semialdehyde dehydrogenase n=1 Tax=Micromonospora sonchi TaxID=1763543 RepID=A0A917U5A5_9ACTN|nr:NAD-dependent succinate-semialdehyde dehydrogenase [Micromonospora sonchi]GGM55982.1 NAD-dependent succinate-semialdehyde dehydrogenase [Micromonospora sonchi]